MTLLDVERGSSVRIVQIPDERARAQCIRFGIGEGTVVDSAERLPLGPVLIRHRSQEICLGRNLARRILIEDTAATGPAASGEAERGGSGFGR